MGDDSYELRASDGVDVSAPQTVQITVTPRPNDAPTCSTVSRTVAPAAAATIQLACTDADGDPVTLETVAGPAHGSLGAIDQGTDRVTYTPDAGYFGADAFTYRATDGRATGPAATVTLAVTHAPACGDVARTTAVGTPVSVPLSCTDPDGGALTLSIAGGPAKGSLGPIAGGSVTYTPDAGAFGTDSFTYGASDGTADSVPATVSILITRLPSCDDVSLKTAVDRPIPVPLVCSDPTETRSRCRSRAARPAARWGRSRAARSPTRPTRARSARTRSRSRPATARRSRRRPPRRSR